MSTTQRTIVGTVASLSPLTVEVDGSTVAVPATSNVAAALAVGQRVELAVQTPHAPVITGIRSSTITLEAANFEKVAASWAPTWSCSALMSISGVSCTATAAKIGPFYLCSVYCSATLGGTPSNIIYFTLPAASSSASATWAGYSSDALGTHPGLLYRTDLTHFGVMKPDWANFALGAFSCAIQGWFTYA